MDEDIIEKRAMDKRIDRMEVKIDKLIDAVTQLVRVEIVLQTIENRLNSQSEFMKHLDGRIDTIDSKIPIYDMGVGLLKKSIATILTLVLTGVVGSFFLFTN
jgi:CII-binding regulator of phage lambda lysogenization HflD|tara:strand:- start:1337 stop:1642 length:306 start_codon:yes stop_codon:yes gene_type:complete